MLPRNYSQPDNRYNTTNALTDNVFNRTRITTILLSQSDGYGQGADCRAGHSHQPAEEQDLNLLLDGEGRRRSQLTGASALQKLLCAFVALNVHKYKIYRV